MPIVANVLSKLNWALIFISRSLLLLISLSALSCGSLHYPNLKNQKITGIHLTGYTNDSLLNQLLTDIPDLAIVGINTLFLEVDYHFDFQSHPELRLNHYITKTAANKLGNICRSNGIRLIPQFQCFGHQSWGKTNSPLLTNYPELDLTPGAFPDNEGIYCREWDMTNPRVNEIVFPMIEEIVQAFGADAVHLGMDEIFLIGSEHSPATFGKDPSKILADAIHEFHQHFVDNLGLEMFIWADRLIDGWKFTYGKWETSLNGTSGAADKIPTDIVLCIWHYGAVQEYPTIPHLISKGFRVLPTSYKDLKGIENLIRYSYSLENSNMKGHLFTTWGRIYDLSEHVPFVRGLEVIAEVK